MASASDRMEQLYIIRRLATKRHISEGNTAQSVTAASSSRDRLNSSETVLAKARADQAAIRLWTITAARSAASPPRLPQASRMTQRNSAYIGSRAKSISI